MISGYLRIRSAFVAGITLVLGLSFTGCASFNRIANYPKPDAATTVTIASKPMSKMSELPIGAYYDEPHHVIVTGHQKGLVPGMLFGVVGVVVADQMNKSAGSSKFGAAAAKGDDLGVILRNLVEESIHSGQAPHWTELAKSGLQLTPYAVFTVEKSGDARLYAMLRAELIGPNGEPTWSARYFARAAGEKPLTDAGWMAPKTFSPAIQYALGRALDACIDDTHGRLTGTKTVTAKGLFPFLNIDLQLRAIVVEEKPDYVVAKLAVGDAMVLAGTHVLDRSDFEIKPADFKDPRK